MHNICKIDGCNSKIIGLGYCNKHYLRLKKHGDPSITKNQLFCNQEDCNNKHFCWGLCDKHSARVRNTGVPELLPHLFCNELNCSEKIFRNKKCNSHWTEQFGSHSKCDYCLENFIRLNGRQHEREKIGSERSFCSKKCRDSYTDEFGFKPKKNIVWCDWCERSFSKPISLAKRAKLKFCSKKCMNFHQQNMGWYEPVNKGVPLTHDQHKKLRDGFDKWNKENDPWNKDMIMSEEHNKKLRKARGKRKYSARHMVDTLPERKIFSMLTVNDIPFLGGSYQLWDDEKQKWVIRLKQKKFQMREGRSHKVDVFIEPNIVIEVDGFYHTFQDRIEQDIFQEENLFEQNQKIIRFSQTDVDNNPQEVFHKILIIIKNYAPKIFEEKKISEVLIANFEKYGYPI
jgi:very-short-patch-repair endonuclease|tara:strand:+ start:59 stop:1255 length:1197 start_codon:yes stop_codon:yes gene_type:complete